MKVKNEVDAFMFHCANMDWFATVKRNLKKGTKEEELDKTKVDGLNVYYICKHMDVMKWWREVGSSRFPHLSLAALILLGKPFHNGFQERVFSRGTYFDGKLRKTLRQDKFELQVLDSLSGVLARDIVRDLSAKIPEEQKDNEAYIKDFLNIRKENYDEVFHEDEVPSYELETETENVTVTHEEQIYDDEDTDDEEFNDDFDSDEESVLELLAKQNNGKGPTDKE